MANREIEAVLRISSKAGSMKALTDTAAKLKAVKAQAEAFNRANVALVSRTARTLTATQQAALANLRRMDVEAAQRQRAMVAVSGRQTSSLMAVYKDMAKFAAPLVTGAALVGSVKNYATLERELTRTGLTIGATREEMAALRSDMEGAARAFALPTSEIMETTAAYAAAGASLSEIRADLPILAKAQQAIGATGQDVVNAWDAARKTLKLSTADTTQFFETVAAGGAAGKFEGRDMAQYLPTLLPVAARQGFKGTEGVTRLVGFLEAMADFSGSAGEAATATSDLLEKISSPDVERKFAKAGISLRTELAKARDSGEDLFKVMHDIIRRATGGDATRIGEFFGDKEARRAADLILNRFDAIRNAQDQVRANAPGVLDRNNAELLKDTEAALERIAQAQERARNAAGKLLVSTGVVDAVDGLSSMIDRTAAIHKALEKQGYGNAASREGKLLFEAARRGFDAEKIARYENDLLWRDGHRSEQDLAMNKYYGHAAATRRIAPSLLKDETGLPISPMLPTPRADALTWFGFDAEWQRQMILQRRHKRRPFAEARGVGAVVAAPTGDPGYDDFWRAATLDAGKESEQRKAGARFLYGDMADGTSFRDAMRIGDDLAEGGEQAGRSIAEAARKVNEAGAEAGSAFSRMLEGAAQEFGAAAARSFRANIGTVSVGIGGGVSGNRGVMPPPGAGAQ